MLPFKLHSHVIGLLVWSVVLRAVAVVAGGSTESAMHTTANAGIEACKRVHGDNAIGKDPIWCIGKLSKTMIVITKGRLVFEMPLDALNRTIDKFYLGNYAPVAMEKKWPVLVHDSHYQDVKNKLYGCLPVRDVDSDYLLFATWKKTDKPQKGGLTLDLTRNSIIQDHWILSESDSKIRWISSGGLAGYYRLTNENNSGVAVRLLHFCIQKPLPHDNDRDFWPAKPCNKFRECDLIMPSCKSDDQDVYPLCQDGSDGLHVIQKKNAQCTPITWEVWNGFVDSGKFYLFGKDYVFIFSEEAYKNPDTKVTVRRVPFGDFIQCGGNPQARDMEVTKKSPVAFGLIVAIILIIVLCCLCILLCLMREAMARRKKKKKGKKGSSKGSSGGGGHGRSGPLSGGARSSGLPGFDALTAMLPGASKRSKGLPSAKPLSRKGKPDHSKRSAGGPSAARPLSRKGGSKRSGGASGPDGSLTKGPKGRTKRSRAYPSAGSNSKKGRPHTKRSAAGPMGAGSISNKGRGRSGPSRGDGGPSNRSRGSHKKGRNISKGGTSAGRSGTNEATGRSGNMRGASRRTKHSGGGSSKHSNKATQRSKLRK